MIKMDNSNKIKRLFAGRVRISTFFSQRIRSGAGVKTGGCGAERVSIFSDFDRTNLKHTLSFICISVVNEYLLLKCIISYNNIIRDHLFVSKSSSQYSTHGRHRLVENNETHRLLFTDNTRVGE